MTEITKEDVLVWHGSDHDKTELAQVVAEVVNGDYPIDQLRSDIKNSRF